MLLDSSFWYHLLASGNSSTTAVFRYHQYIHSSVRVERRKGEDEDDEDEEVESEGMTTMALLTHKDLSLVLS